MTTAFGASCHQADYPKIIGGSAGATYVSQIAVKDLSMVAVGTSSDSVVTKIKRGTNPFLAFYSGDNMLLQWSNALSLPSYHLPQVAFNSNGSSIVTFANPGSVSNTKLSYIIIVSAVDGKLKSVTSSRQIGMLSSNLNTMLLSSHSDTLYLSSVVETTGKKEYH